MSTAFLHRPEPAARHSGPVERQDVIEKLRSHIRKIEGAADVALPASGRAREVHAEDWTLGIPALDALLGAGGLDAGGVHEIRGSAFREGAAAAAATTAAMRAFALLLAVRRIDSQKRPGPVLWCLSAAAALETGAPSRRGLAVLGLDPGRLIIVTPRKTQDVLWVIEEAAKASCLSLVLGEVKDVGVTAARRLSLASAEARTPCLVVTSAGAGSSVVTSATRWRVSPSASAADPLDTKAPGARGFHVVLERCRAKPLVTGSADFAVEWSDAARCFRMAAAIPHRASAPGARSQARGSVAIFDPVLAPAASRRTG
jgi:protein ImuA